MGTTRLNEAQSDVATLSSQNSVARSDGPRQRGTYHPTRESPDTYLPEKLLSHGSVVYLQQSILLFLNVLL